MLSRETMLGKLHLRDEFYRRRARQSSAEFIRFTKPDYQLSWFYEELGIQGNVVLASAIVRMAKLMR